MSHTYGEGIRCIMKLSGLEHLKGRLPSWSERGSRKQGRERWHGVALQFRVALGEGQCQAVAHITLAAIPSGAVSNTVSPNWGGRGSWKI